jgi:hypothetical protein
MLKLILLISVVSMIIPINVRAITCSEDSAETPVSLLSGTAPNGRPASLRNFELQDQDGMGTCYANSLSAMLEANLPGNPQVSFQQIAMNHGMSLYSPRRGRAHGMRPGPNGSNIFISEGGLTCAAFEASRRRGFLCQRDSVPIERMGLTQASVVHSLGTFYDSYTLLAEGGTRSVASNGSGSGTRSERIRPDRRAARAVRENLVNLVQHSLQEASVSCVSPVPEPNPPAMLERLNTGCVAAYQEKLGLESELAETYGDGSGGDSESGFVGGVEELEEQIAQAESRLAHFGTASHTVQRIEKGDEIIERDVITCSLREELTNSVRDDYFRTLERGGYNLTELLTSFATQNHIPSEVLLPSEDPQMLEQYYIRDTNMADPEWCRQNQAWMSLRDAGNLRRTFFELTQVCLTEQFSNDLGIAVSGLGQLSSSQLPTEDILRALSRVDRDIDDFMMGIIGSDCMPPDERGSSRREPASREASSARISIPSDISCHDNPLPVNVPPVVRADGSKDHEAWTELTTRRSRQLLQRTIQNNVDNNRPVAVSICTSFFTDRSADSYYAGNCNATGPHAMHSVTVAGYRCRNGVVEYQLQNSWGQGCGHVTNPEYYSTLLGSGSGSSSDTPRFLYDCDSEGGYFWVPEDILLKNTSSISHLE